ncbi:SufD family Fe-S cluster assembly protein [Patescibacteria group bacterium]|nr:SufD family Fe-S cluster assembly protein [Patescibacteria group bacterium]
MSVSATEIGTKQEITISRGERKDHPTEIVINEDSQIILNAEENSFSEYVIKVHDAHLDLEVILKKGSELIINLSVKDGVITQRGRAGENAKLYWKNKTSGNVKQDLVSEVTGANGESSVHWIFRASEKDQLELSAKNIFSAANGKGEMMMKGVAEDEACVRCNGMIEVGVGGRGSDVFLKEDILMLDKTAKVDVLPGLEIKNNDVKVSHSASVRHVSPEEIFYFASRGVGEEEAREMYVEGFLGNI